MLCHCHLPSLSHPCPAQPHPRCQRRVPAGHRAPGTPAPDTALHGKKKKKVTEILVFKKRFLKKPHNLTTTQATPLNPALAPLCKSQSKPPCCTGNAASKKSLTRKKVILQPFPPPPRAFAGWSLPIRTQSRDTSRLTMAGAVNPGFVHWNPWIKCRIKYQHDPQPLSRPPRPPSTVQRPSRRQSMAEPQVCPAGLCRAEPPRQTGHPG